MSNNPLRFWMGMLLVAIGAYGGYVFWKIAKHAAAGDLTSRSDEKVAARGDQDDALKGKDDSRGWTPAEGVGQESAVGSQASGDGDQKAADRGQGAGDASREAGGDGQASESEEQPDPGDFALTMQTGELFQSKSLKGKVWVASFFFTLCPKECRLQNEAIALIRKQLDNDDITWVSITCDPKMDTVSVLEKYSKRFNADPKTWKFLTGPFDRIKGVALNYFKIPFDKQVHGTKLILIDRDGSIAGYFNVFEKDEVAKFKKKVVELLVADEKEKASSDQAADTKAAPEKS